MFWSSPPAVWTRRPQRSLDSSLRMRVLFDHNVPAVLRRHLQNHEVKDAFKQGWDRLRNGDLLTAAESAGFDVFVTSDKGIRYQQNLTGRKIAVVQLGQGQWPLIQPHIPRVIEAIDAAMPGSYSEIEILFTRKSAIARPKRPGEG